MDLKTQPTEFKQLNEIEMLEIKSRLEQLEEIVNNLNLTRESLTRALVVNGCKDAEMLEEKIKKVMIQEKEDTA